VPQRLCLLSSAAVAGISCQQADAPAADVTAAAKRDSCLATASKNLGFDPARLGPPGEHVPYAHGWSERCQSRLLGQGGHPAAGFARSTVQPVPVIADPLTQPASRTSIRGCGLRCRPLVSPHSQAQGLAKPPELISRGSPPFQRLQLSGFQWRVGSTVAKAGGPAFPPWPSLTLARQPITPGGAQAAGPPAAASSARSEPWRCFANASQNCWRAAWWFRSPSRAARREPLAAPPTAAPPAVGGQVPLHPSWPDRPASASSTGLQPFRRSRWRGGPAPGRSAATAGRGPAASSLWPLTEQAGRFPWPPGWLLARLRASTAPLLACCSSCLEQGAAPGPASGGLRRAGYRRLVTEAGQGSGAIASSARALGQLAAGRGAEVGSL